MQSEPTTASTAVAPSTAAPIPAASLGPVPGPTVRSIIAGTFLAILLCAMNSYLTLSFGVIEEGPTIAALFFFAMFFLSRTKITTTEMVLVATMGSAGGSFGFIANFYAAKAMTGTPYTLTQMIAFGIVSSMVGIVMVVPLRELLIRRANLPWPGPRATETVIRSLVQEGDPKQPWYLLITVTLMLFYVVFNKEDGYSWFPAEIHLGASLAAFGGAISLSPFAIGGSYLMGMRTCVGFLVGALVLMGMGYFSTQGHLPDVVAATPHKYVWPGIGFLTASGLVLIAVNWKVMASSFRSLLTLGKPGAADDPEQVMSGKMFLTLLGIAFVATVVVMHFLFGVPLLLVVILFAVGGLVQNIIATRAQAQTNFNPARVMGILLEGVCFLFGGRATATNLTGAGFVAGSGAQASMLTADMAYGKPFRVPPRWQFLTQLATIIPSTVVAAYVFQFIAKSKDLSLESSSIAAPVAKVWATTSLIFDGSRPMPHGAMESLLIGALIGTIYTLLEQNKKIEKFLPCSVGLGLGLILAPAYGIAFFVGGFLEWIVLGRWLKVSAVTLTTIAVGCIVADGIGGVLKAILANFHVAGLGL